MGIKQKKSKQKPEVKEPIILPKTREALMLMAKERAIKNFRVLNKAELLQVLADGVELGRVISNLLENARKYGKSVDTGVARMEVIALAQGKWVYIKLRDHGIGVAPDQLAHLTQPFYRGEAARTAANGAGLGLAIVEKTIARMGGAFSLKNASNGGLAAHIKLQRAP